MAPWGLETGFLIGVSTVERATLYLEDGTRFEGIAFGAREEALGEVVFNTSMTGYQEVLTDPSYAGQIVVMTQPEIGNYGTNAEDQESLRPFVEGFVVRECSRIYSNWRGEQSLGDYLCAHGVGGISEIDTRALVRHIRERGAMQPLVRADAAGVEAGSEVTAIISVGVRRWRHARAVDAMRSALAVTTPLCSFHTSPWKLFAGAGLAGIPKRAAY